MPKTKWQLREKLIYFTDIDGVQVAMNTRRLTELPSAERAFDWFTTPKALRAAARLTLNGELYSDDGLRIFRLGCEHGITVSFGSPTDAWPHGTYYIGCHGFSKTIFNRILRRAGVKV
jgi:hypothetical protein